MKIWQRTVAVVATFALLFNSLAIPLTVLAQEATPEPTPEATAQPTDTPTPTIEAIATPEATIEATATPTAILETTPTPSPSPWTFENVELNKEYIAPQNSGVKLTFTKLPSPSGNIKIEEITLSEEQIKQIGSVSNKAYDITSDMKDGDFSYNLSLPIPEASKGKAVEVKFAEELSNIASAEKVETNLTKTDTSVSVNNLDHFTIFVVVGTIDGVVATNFTEESNAVIINEFVFNPSTGNDWIELYNKGITDRNLSGWVLDDDDTGTSTVMANLTQTIPAKGFLAVDVLNRLNTDNDTIVLKDNSGTTVSKVSYKDGVITVTGAQDIGTVGTGESVARNINGGGIWAKVSLPTKGYTNENSTIYVDDGNTSGNEFGTTANPFNTIQEGIDATLIGGTVNVAAGTYNENITVDKSLTLTGASSATVTVTAASSASSVFTVTANNVEILGFTVSGATGGGQAGIYIGNSVTGSNIHNNSLTGNFDGIWLGSGSNNNTLENNTLSSNTTQGFEVYHSDNNTFTNNHADSNTGYGFKMESADNNTFTNNTANSNTKYGFYLAAGSSNSDNNTLTNNTANSNTEYGIRINSGSGNTLTGNTFNLNVIDGIRLKDTITNLTLDSNDFTNSQIGIDIATVGTDVTSWTVSSNNISGNTTFNVSNVGSDTLNATNNYWGSASPNFDTIISGNVNHDPWYVDEGKTTLSSAIDAIFDDVSSMLISQGIESNIGDVTASNFTAFPDLYFEKSVTIGEITTKMGKITFTSALDLSKDETKTFLENLGTKMNMAETGIISLDFRGTTSDLSLKDVSATIEFYGLDELGFTADSTSDEVNSKLIAYDDDGNILDKADLVDDPGTYTPPVGVCEVGGACYIFSVDVNHFTKYKIDEATQTTPDIDGDATLSGDTTEVVITDPDQPVTVTVADGTDNPTIDVSAFVSDNGEGGVEGTLPEITINSDVADVVIPDGTVVTGPAGWDGIIDAPRAVTSAGTAPSGFAVGDNIIEIGSSDGVLYFDQAVKITLPGVTGIVAYKPAGSNDWQTITTVCNGADDASNISSGECYFHAGGDTIIWTYHFTSFGDLDTDVCANIDGAQSGVPDGMHLDATGLNCVNWGASGPSPRNDEGTGGQVLGISTSVSLKSWPKLAYVGNGGTDENVLGTETEATPGATTAPEVSTPTSPVKTGVINWILTHKKISLGAIMALIVVGYFVSKKRT